MGGQVKTAAIVLAAGSGSRMNSRVKKQYLPLEGYPLICYSLRAFEESFVDQVILVVSPGEAAYCRENIVERYDFRKITAVVEGGRERYHSVWQGIQAIDDCDYLFVHDGARPFVTGEILRRTLEQARLDGACVAAMPAKDTVRIADGNEYASQTPERARVWLIQTPQVFAFSLIREAYSSLMREEVQEMAEGGTAITDDAMVVERMTGQPIKLVRGSYDNIKITTPEDLPLARAILRERGRKAYPAE